METAENGLTHFDGDGNAIMVDVTQKKITHREAEASGIIRVSPSVMKAVTEGTVKKGDVLGVARIAGIMGVKKTSELIPLCHPLPITSCHIDFQMQPEECAIKAFCRVKVDGQTGVEMEALNGVQIALLTIYDMCKAIDKGMLITDVHLETKTGGKSGDFTWEGRLEV